MQSINMKIIVIRHVNSGVKLLGRRKKKKKKKRKEYLAVG